MSVQTAFASLRSAVEERVFLDALYPGRDAVDARCAVTSDHRPLTDPAAVRAMTAVLGQRSGTPSRAIARGSATPFPVPPSLPPLIELKGGLLDAIRMRANTAILREFATQTAVWADVVEDHARAHVARLEATVAEREAELHRARRRLDIAETEVETMRARVRAQLLAGTVADRRALAAALTIHALPPNRRTA